MKEGQVEGEEKVGIEKKRRLKLRRIEGKGLDEEKVKVEEMRRLWLRGKKVLEELKVKVMV